MRGAGAGSGTAEMFRAGVLIGSGEVLVWGARTGQWAYRPFPAIRFRRNLAGRQMPNTTCLILASSAAVDCQLNPALTRATATPGAEGQRSRMPSVRDSWTPTLTGGAPCSPTIPAA